MLNHDAGLATCKLSDPDTVAHDVTYFCAGHQLPVLETGRSGYRMVCVGLGFSFVASGKPENPLTLWVAFYLFWLLRPII